MLDFSEFCPRQRSETVLFRPVANSCRSTLAASDTLFNARLEGPVEFNIGRQGAIQKEVMAASISFCLFIRLCALRKKGPRQPAVAIHHRLKCSGCIFTCLHYVSCNHFHMGVEQQSKRVKHAASAPTWAHVSVLGEICSSCTSLVCRVSSSLFHLLRLGLKTNTKCIGRLEESTKLQTMGANGESGSWYHSQCIWAAASVC